MVTVKAEPGVSRSAPPLVKKGLMKHKTKSTADTKPSLTLTRKIKGKNPSAKGKKWKKKKKSKKVKKVYTTAWRPGRPYKTAYGTLAHPRANFGEPGSTLDKAVLQVLAFRFTVVCPDTPEALAMRRAMKVVDLARRLPETGQAVVLNPRYKLGRPRFGVVVLRNSVRDVHDLLGAVEELDEVSARAYDRGVYIGAGQGGSRAMRDDGFGNRSADADVTYRQTPRPSPGIPAACSSACRRPAMLPCHSTPPSRASRRRPCAS